MSDMTNTVFIDSCIADDNDSETMKKSREKLPPCPICGQKAFLDHDIVDGFDFGYSAGCPSFCLNDGIHGIKDIKDPRAPRSVGYSKRQVVAKWIAYCRRMKEVD